MYLNLIAVTVCIMIFVAIYVQGMERDRNLAYTAMYYDDAAVEAYMDGNTISAITLSGVAIQFCDLYLIENRTIHEMGRYAPLCDAIELRGILFVMCGDGKTICPQYRVDELERLLERAEPIAKDLKDSPPYYSYTLGYDFTFVDQNGDPVTILPEIQKSGGREDAGR